MNGILELLKILAALLSIGFGVFSVLQPEAIAKASHYRITNGRGWAELRVLSGGFFIGIGLGAILLGSVFDGGHNAAYQVVGFAWLGAALVRVLNLIIEDDGFKPDGPLRTRGYWGLLLSEIVPGFILIWPI